MRDRSASACYKHLDRAMKDVVGNRNAITARILGVGGTGQHFCYCGKVAAFHIVQVKDGDSGKEKSSSAKSGEGKA